MAFSAMVAMANGKFMNPLQVNCCTSNSDFCNRKAQINVSGVVRLRPRHWRERGQFDEARADAQRKRCWTPARIQSKSSHRRDGLGLRLGRDRQREGERR